jgi:hypothetical protein
MNSSPDDIFLGVELKFIAFLKNSLKLKFVFREAPPPFDGGVKAL